MIKIDAGQDWTIESLYEINLEIEKIAAEMGLDYYPNQIEIITSEQMMDAYSSVGLPLMYNHWSFGKNFLKTKSDYDNGRQGLAYEIVINTDPCIVYIMENNTMLMQTLVLAHAGIGHNHFFKNNTLFKEWTKANNIVDYLEFAKKYIAKCEEKYGPEEVEKLLDYAHSLQHTSVFRYKHKEKISFKKEMERKIFRALDEEKTFDPVLDTIQKKKKDVLVSNREMRQKKLQLPEENILYFLEKHSPVLKTWQREILRIVRNIGQYFYPQIQDKIMNEGCATWTHYTILNKLYDKGILTDGAMIEFLKSHSNVVFQPEFDDPRYSGINPYALGFAMMQDIERICEKPNEEDFELFPDIAGCNDSLNVLKYAWANFRDESFIRQYLSPTVMRKFKFFSLDSNPTDMYYNVANIANDRGFKEIRTALADRYDITNIIPEVNVIDADMNGDRQLQLEFIVNNNCLHKPDAEKVLDNICQLWGYSVKLEIKSTAGSTIDTIVKFPVGVSVEEDVYYDTAVFA